jgi:hypothetical protein
VVRCHQRHFWRVWLPYGNCATVLLRRRSSEVFSCASESRNFLGNVHPRSFGAPLTAIMAPSLGATNIPARGARMDVRDKLLPSNPLGWHAAGEGWEWPR